MEPGGATGGVVPKFPHPPLASVSCATDESIALEASNGNSANHSTGKETAPPIALLFRPQLPQLQRIARGAGIHSGGSTASQKIDAQTHEGLTNGRRVPHFCLSLGEVGNSDRTVSSRSSIHQFFHLVAFHPTSSKIGEKWGAHGLIFMYKVYSSGER